MILVRLKSDLGDQLAAFSALTLLVDDNQSLQKGLNATQEWSEMANEIKCKQM